MQDAGGLIQAFAGLQATRLTSAAATTIYLYNILLTLDLEVEHVWSCLSFSLPTVLYLVNRYISLGFFLVLTYNLAGYHGAFSDAYCKLPINFIGFVLAYTGWTGILTMRVCALYRQRRYLVWAIQITWVVVMCANIVTEYFAYREEGATISYNSFARLCTPTSTPHIFKLTPVAPMVYELFLTIMTIVKAFDFVVHPSNLSLPLLYRVLARDGVMYFVASTTITAVNMIAWYCLPGSHLYLICSIYWAMMSTILAQMMLNLKDTYKRAGLSMGLETEGVDGHFTFDSPNQTAFMGDPIILGRKGLGILPTPKVTMAKLGSDESRSPTCKEDVSESSCERNLEKLA